MNRRDLLALAASAAVASIVAPQLLAAGADTAAVALAESDLVYLTPLRGDGQESSCHAEVWFVHDGRDVLVVTAADAWRARAVRAGLDRARLWVGEFGVWTSSNAAFRRAPQLETRASLVTDPAAHGAALDLFGSKYRLEWLVWGPRFRSGLADGSRVLLRYRPLA